MTHFLNSSHLLSFLRQSALLLSAGMAAALALPGVAAAQSKMEIEVVGIGKRQLPVAIAPFDAADPAVKSFSNTVTSVVRANLARSGAISIVDTGTPSPALNERSPTLPLFVEYKQKGADALAIGSSATTLMGRMETRFIVLDIARSTSLGGLAITSANSELEARRTGHRIADFIYEKLTGEPGFFATRLAFVRKDGDNYSLVVSDSDGQNSQVALRSKQPVISLAWSPDGTQLAYVSFEDRNGVNKPIVYVHNLSSGSRRIVANEKGSNSSPAWSPDGSKLALVLTRDGNSQIYLASADGGDLTRLAVSSDIDTEPTFTPDGKFIYFTSNRGGSAQIYRIPVTGGEAQRITFEGQFNARPQISSDGKFMSYITRRDKTFRVAVMDLSNQQEKIISEGPKDDSPSFAPNGKWIIYSSRIGNRNVLSAVSIDGTLRTRLSAEGSEIKGPAWGRLP